MISVEVIYALADEQTLISCQVPAGSNVQYCIEHSGVLEKYPQITLSSLTIGIFSQTVRLSDIVQAGDRIEIYRDLQIDPKEARKQRANAARTSEKRWTHKTAAKS